MSDRIKSIQNYIEYLRKQHNLSISIHIKDKMFAHLNPILTIHNSHNNPYCILLKMNKDIWSKCLECQNKVKDLCDINDSFFGMCHAGVEEFVYTITCKGENFGFISVSGFCSNKEKAYYKIRKLSDHFKVDYNKTVKMYNDYINTKIPDKKFLDDIIAPLACMFELIYLNWLLTHESDVMQTNSDVIYTYLLHHINFHYSQNLSLELLKNIFGYSESYISRIFKKNNGKSINEYICDLRISNAKFLLEMNVLNISDIAAAVGFEDSNYFSTIFKKKCGQSPLKWKKEHVTNKDYLNKMK